MPSMEHEGPLQLIENAPDLSPRLLRALGVEVPDYIEARIGKIDFTQAAPTQYLADKVVTLWTGRKHPALGIINELQLQVDPRKKYTWPLYSAALRAEQECDVCLLVIALNEATARWAREPICGLQPGCTFTPLVAGPAEVPWVRTVAQAEREPELAVLSAMAHGNAEGGLEVAEAAVQVVAHLDNERRALYADLVYRSLTQKNLQKLVHIMDLSQYEPQSEICKTWKNQGLTEGRREGMAEGKAEDLLCVLADRALALTEEQRQRILSCRDPLRLDTWFKRSLRAATVEEILV